MLVASAMTAVSSQSAKQFAVTLESCSYKDVNFPHYYFILGLLPGGE